MTVIIENPLIFDISLLKSSSNTKLFDSSKAYFLTFIELYNMNNFFQRGIKNIDKYLFLFGADNAQKIDNILLKLEEITDYSSELLESQEINKWYNYPIYYAFNKMETSCMSLQALLASKEALMAHNEAH